MRVSFRLSWAIYEALSGSGACLRYSSHLRRSPPDPHPAFTSPQMSHWRSIDKSLIRVTLSTKREDRF